MFFEQTFSLACTDSSEDHTQDIVREFDTSGDIETTLTHIRDFLRACGFTYVTQLVAVVDNGGEFVSQN